MKRIMILALALALVFSLALTGNAAGEKLTLSNAEAQPGQTVYLTVTLNESAMGDTMGVTYTYDSSVLTAVPSSCSWVKAGVLQDFNNNGAGVWATTEIGDLKGTVCVLAFRVKENASFTQTEVSCTLIVKNDSTEVGTFTAQASVTKTCSHTYGTWSDQGTLGHTKVCGICGAQVTESHSWDEGIRSQKPNDSTTDLMTFTCTVCSGAKVIEVPANNTQETTGSNSGIKPGDTIPVATVPEYVTEMPSDKPQPTYPTYSDRDEEDHDHSVNQGSTGSQNGSSNQGGNGSQNGSSNQGSTGSQNGSSNQGGNGSQNGSSNQGSTGSQNTQETISNPYQDFNQQTASGEDEQDRSHDGEDYEEHTIPLIVPATGEAETTELDHDHTADTTVSSEERSVNILIVFGFLAVVVGAAMYFVKKKH